jgi:uncharacterized protein (UPF0210 family)
VKIRAITSFFDPIFNPDDNSLVDLSRCSAELTAAFSTLGYTVQSQRAATNPFPQWLHQVSRDEWQDRIIALAQETTRLGWQYTSVGPALPTNIVDYELVPGILAAHPGLFASGIIADRGLLFPPAAQAVAKVIVDCAKLTPDGFTNLRFAALCNVRPYAPFLPAAYAETGQPPAIALAIECADEVVNAFEKADSLESGRNELLASLEYHAKVMGEKCQAICDQYSVVFKGFDFSPAPYPENWCSLGKAIELMGVSKLGNFGSLAAAAFLASTLDMGRWQRTGFNGLMLAVLEDSTLAQRAAEGSLTIKDLLLYSAVCGTGLDTIPLPGDTNEEQLLPLLMDLGALSVRLNKPLTGRLMPIPGKKAGDETDFDFEFFARSRVMDLQTLPITNPLASAGKVAIQPRNSD